MAGLVPAIHVLAFLNTGMPGIKPGMTNGGNILAAIDARYSDPDRNGLHNRSDRPEI